MAAGQLSKDTTRKILRLCCAHFMELNSCDTCGDLFRNNNNRKNRKKPVGDDALARAKENGLVLESVVHLCKRCLDTAQVKANDKNRNLKIAAATAAPSLEETVVAPPLQASTTSNDNSAGGYPPTLVALVDCLPRLSEGVAASARGTPGSALDRSAVGCGALGGVSGGGGSARWSPRLYRPLQSSCHVNVNSCKLSKLIDCSTFLRDAGDTTLVSRDTRARTRTASKINS